MVLVKFIILVLVLVPSFGVSLCFSESHYKFFVLDLCEHLGGNIKSGWRGGVRGHLSLFLLLESRFESRSDLMLFTLSL